MENPNPSPTPNQYVINNVQQLFAINNNLVNFKSKFQVTSLSNEPFQGLVVNQQSLDSGQALQFRNADAGVFSGEITQDNNIPNNWYLALKSAKPNKVVIDFQTIPIAPRPAEAAATENNAVAQAARTNPRDTSSSGSGWSSYFTFQNMIKLLIGVGVLSAVYFLAKRYLKRRQDKGLADADDYAALAPDAGGDDLGLDLGFETGGDGGSTLVGTTAPVAAATAAPAAPAASTGVEGTSTATVLGDDLLNKVNNLPAI
jgi:hypothetical protein